MTPHPFWPELETEMFDAATGLDFSKEDLEEAALRSLLLFRAIEIRNHGRTREMEVKEAYRPLQYPDCEGTTTTWEEFNELVDVFYDYCGWDKKTGWPTRETYEKYGLGYVADELNALGKLPN
jgi:aldehyde:ferredoxin oxidoreductase